MSQLDNRWFWFPSTTDAGSRGSIANSRLNLNGLLWIATVEPPVISPNGGFFVNQSLVTLTDATAGAVIHYTTNGTTPTQFSPIYTAPFLLHHSAMVKAIAFKNSFNSSDVTSAYFTIMSSGGGPLLCWQFTAKQHNGRIFQLNGDGPFPEVIHVPQSVDTSSCVLVDEGVIIDPTQYQVITTTI